MCAHVGGRNMPSMNTTWTASAHTGAAPAAVLDVLTDPDAVARWSPVAFDIEDDATRRLRTGTKTRVTGKLAGVRVGFDVHVHHADDRQLRLSASGPVKMHVDYDVAPTSGGSELRASISLAKGRGLMAGLLAEATAGLLRAGALSHAVNRIAATA